MRSLVVLVLLAIAPSAFGQDARWMIEDAESMRFVEADTKGPDFRDGEKVTLLYTEGDLLRVRRGDRYGWIPATAVTADEPERATDLPVITAPTGPAGEFDLEALEDLLQKTEEL